MQTPLTKSPPTPHTLNGCGLGGVGLEGVEVLVGLGLSRRQARVYLALLRAGDAKARTVADLTMIDRQEVYRVLDSLRQLGLIQQNIVVPASYMATLIEEAMAHTTAFPS